MIDVALVFNSSVDDGDIDRTEDNDGFRVGLVDCIIDGENVGSLDAIMDGLMVGTDIGSVVGRYEGPVGLVVRLLVGKFGNDGLTLGLEAGLPNANIDGVNDVELEIPVETIPVVDPVMISPLFKIFTL